MHMNAKFGIVVHIEYLCVCVHFGNPRAEMSFNISSEVMHLIGSELWISTLHHGRVEFHGQHVEQSQWPFWQAITVVFLNSLHYFTRSPLSVITISGKHYNWNNRLTISLRNWLNLNNETDWYGAPVKRLPRYSLLVERYSMRLHLMVRQLEDYILWTWFWDVAHGSLAELA